MLNLSKLNDQNKLISSELDKNPRTVDQLLKEIEDSKVRQIMDEVYLNLFHLLCYIRSCSIIFTLSTSLI